MTVYLDLVIFLNFLVDFLLILATNRLSGFSPGWKRAATAGALGAVYAGGCLLPGWSFLAGTVWRLVSLALMSMIAFGWGNGALRRGVLFVFLSMALGGIALGLGNGGFFSLILGALGVLIACLVGFCGRPGQQSYVPVTVSHRGRRVHLTALVDTGNTLKDPISGRSVLVVDGEVAQKLTDLPARAVEDPVATVGKGEIDGLRLIPYHAVGQSGGMLLGLRVDKVELNGRQVDMIVAFAPQKIGRGKPYQALTGGSMG